LAGVVCFGDEGGGFRVCSRVCVALLCFEKTGGVAGTPRSLYEAVVGLLGWRRGELKWRSVKKAARRRGVEPLSVARLVLGSALAYSIAAGHLGDSREAQVLKDSLLLEAAEAVAGCLGGRRVTLILDAHLATSGAIRSAARLLGASYARMVDSRRFLGVQLADIVAGACSERVVEPGSGCG